MDTIRAFIAVEIGNQARQKITEEIFEHAKKMVEEKMLNDKILVVACPGIGEADNQPWPEGVMGLVAGRLCEAYSRPALVITKFDKEIKGSGRSIEEFNIIRAVEQLSQHLKKFGGHAAAAGLTWLEQTLVRAWRAPLEVAVVPINGDGSPEAAQTIRALQASDFDDIDAFLERESARYGVKLSPAMQVSLLPALDEMPPVPPREVSLRTSPMISDGIVAEKIRSALAEPYLLTRKQEDGTEISVEHHCASSIGIVLFIDHEASPEEALKCADMAMYQAKEGGRNAVRFYAK